MSQTFNTFNTFIYNEYQRTENGIELSSSLPVLSTYAKPTNNLNIETKGLEFDLNIMWLCRMQLRRWLCFNL